MGVLMKSSYWIDRRTTLAMFVVAGCFLMAGCSTPSSDPPSISLVHQFSEAEVADSPDEIKEYPRLEWRFDGGSTIPQAPEPGPYAAWTPLNGIEQIRIQDGILKGKISGKFPILAVEIPMDALPRDLLHAIEVRVRSTKGTEFGVMTFRDPEIDLETFLKEMEENANASFQTDFEPGDDLQTIKLTERNVRFTRTTPLRSIRHLGLMFFDAEGAEIEVESVRLITRNEELSSASSGVGWQGLGNIYRETIVSRAPERIAFDLQLGQKPWLDLSVGTPNPHPVTFVIDVSNQEGDPISLRRTVTTADEWLDVVLPLETTVGLFLGLKNRLQHGPRSGSRDRPKE